MDISAWNEVADAVAAVPDRSRTGGLIAALSRVGMPAKEREELVTAIAGRQDPAGLVLAAVVAVASVGADVDEQAPPAWSTAEMDRALAVADRLRQSPVDAMGDHVGAGDVAALEALPADAAGALVLDLVSRAVGVTDPARRADGLHGAEVVAGQVTASRLPVADLVRAGAGLTGEDRRLVARILGRVPTGRLLRGVAQALSVPTGTIVSPRYAGVAGPESVGALLDEVAVARAGLPPTRIWRPASGAEPPPVVFRGGPPQTHAQPPAPGLPPPPPGLVIDRGAAPGTSEPASRTAYPRIDLTTNTARPDVVVVDLPFVATIGLGPRITRGIIGTGSIVTEPGSDTEIEVVLVYDPASLRTSGPRRFTLTVTDDAPYPAQEVTLTAVYLVDAPPTRRIGVHYLRDGQVVGVAFLSFAVVDETAQVAAAPAPPARQATLLDISPALAEGAPDLVVAVCRSDTSPTSWVWTAYATSVDLTVPDAPNVAALDSDVSAFALETRRAIQFSADKVADYYTLAGRAKRIGAAIPDAIQTTLRDLVGRPGLTTAPSVLLLTEEVVIPWELGCLDPPLSTPWGATSPFLGAHVAVGRWPLTEGKPRPVPKASVSVSRGAVITADYTGVPGWGKLAEAQAEASAVSKLFDPAAPELAPDLRDVIGLLRGTPAADIVHVALHGQFDNQGDQEGIVLVAKDAGGAPKAQFLTPLMVENGALATGPFVFLNACQVGADERVLASYGGFASTLLRIGAGAVVAPLWNVDDDVAGAIASSFYAATWTTPTPVGIGEAVRAIRATYTEEAVLAGTAGITATLVAFQVFGNPRMTLTRAT